jgi:hypothetical protein
VVVPSDNMQIIEDVHVAIAHSAFRVVRHEIQEKNQAGGESALADHLLQTSPLAFAGKSAE